MKHKTHWRRGTVACFFALWATAAPAASAPGDQIQATIDKVLEVLKDSNLKKDSNRANRLEQLKAIIEPQFDFAEMAKRSLGAQWQRRTAEEQREFVNLFRELIENSYIDSIDSYNGEKVTITSQKQEQNFADVNTKVVNKKGEESAINYKLMNGDNGWKIYDVVIENISLVNNYRSQFTRIISQSSYDDLMRKMRQKEMAAPAKKS
jgi:phospholipid transport system substrate-binding protein